MVGKLGLRFSVSGDKLPVDIIPSCDSLCTLLFHYSSGESKPFLSPRLPQANLSLLQPLLQLEPQCSELIHIRRILAVHWDSRMALRCNSLCFYVVRRALLSKSISG